MSITPWARSADKALVRIIEEGGKTTSTLSKTPRHSEFANATSCDEHEEVKCPDRISGWGKGGKD